MKIPESDIENYLVKKVRLAGGSAFKGNPFGQRGFMDRICMFNGGLVIFVEVKAPGRKPRPNQRLMIKKFKAMGFIAVWLDTFAKVDTLIDWAKDYQLTTKCIRADCPMRRVK